MKVQVSHFDKGSVKLRKGSLSATFEQVYALGSPLLGDELAGVGVKLLRPLDDLDAARGHSALQRPALQHEGKYFSSIKNIWLFLGWSL